VHKTNIFKSVNAEDFKSSDEIASKGFARKNGIRSVNRHYPALRKPREKPPAW